MGRCSSAQSSEELRDSDGRMCIEDDQGAEVRTFFPCVHSHCFVDRVREATVATITVHTHVHVHTYIQNAESHVCDAVMLLSRLNACMYARYTHSYSDDVWSLDLATLRWRRHAEETSASSGVADEEGDASDMRWCAPFGGSGRAFHSAVCFETPAPVSAEDAVGGGGGGGPVTEDAVSDLIFIFGGRTSGGALTSSLHMIDAKDMRWMSLSEIVRGTTVPLLTFALHTHTSHNADEIVQSRQSVTDFWLSWTRHRRQCLFCAHTHSLDMNRRLPIAARRTRCRAVAQW